MTQERPSCGTDSPPELVERIVELIVRDVSESPFPNFDDPMRLATTVSDLSEICRSNLTEELHAERSGDAELVEALALCRRALASAIHLLNDCEISHPLLWHDALDRAEDAILAKHGERQ